MDAMWCKRAIGLWNPRERQGGAPMSSWYTVHPRLQMSDFGDGPFPRITSGADDGRRKQERKGRAEKGREGDEGRGKLSKYERGSGGHAERRAVPRGSAYP